VFIQTFIALTTKVMADILIKLLAQQPVLVLQPGVLRLQRGDTRTHLFILFEQRGVGRASLTRTKSVCSIVTKLFSQRRYQSFFDRTSSP
jgi:hypothetical protein